MNFIVQNNAEKEFISYFSWKGWGKSKETLCWYWSKANFETSIFIFKIAISFPRPLFQ